VLRPLDSALLIAFNQRVQLLDPASNNWKQLSKDLNKVKAAGETAAYDAVATAAQMPPIPGLPAKSSFCSQTVKIIAVTSASRMQFIRLCSPRQTFTRSAQVGVCSPEQEEAGAENLKQPAESTGGQYLISNDGRRIARAFYKIHRELRSQYAIGYKPSDITASVRCRKGYYPN
jgi:Ca-activated chloride channel homolog